MKDKLKRVLEDAKVSINSIEKLKAEVYDLIVAKETLLAQIREIDSKITEKSKYIYELEHGGNKNG